jgi:hypothetical protein
MLYQVLLPPPQHTHTHNKENNKEVTYWTGFPEQMGNK